MEDDGLMAHRGEARHAYVEMMKMVSIKSRRKAKASSHATTSMSHTLRVVQEGFLI